MAQLTEPMFSINGNLIKQFTSFSLNQCISDHHYFSLVVPATSIDGTGGLFTSSQDMIGSTFGARISGLGLGGNVLFNGIITSVETSRFAGHHGDVIIMGYSPTIVLDSGPHCKSWEKKTIKSISEDVLKFFPQNLLEAKVQPLYSEELGYTVQYRESAWKFLQRITGSYGEWLFWDGRNLVVGPPQTNTKVALVYGSTLSRFNVTLQARPTAMQYISWDYQNSQVYTSQPQGVEQKAGLNPWGEKVFQRARSVYGTQPKQWNYRHANNKKQQDDLATMRSAVESSKMVRFTGQSGHPGIVLGGTIEVSGNNVYSAGTEGYGEYLVTAVNHHVDAMGNYENDFTAIPASINVPPVTIPDDPVCETQSAIVTNNHDPQGLGRVQVKMHWMNGAEKTPWIRVTTPHAGGGKGHFFIPEIGEEVVVGFEGDSATKPYVIGAVYHQQADNNFSNAGNDVKAIQTRCGTKIIMNDAEGSVFVEDPSGNTWFMDGKGNIKVNAPNDMEIAVGKNFNITVGENMTTSIGKNEQLSVGNDKNVTISKNYTQFSENKNVTVSKNKTEHTGDTYHHVAGTSDIQTSKGDLKLRGSGLAVFQGGKDVKISKG
ncbi:type VI secretion system Vgr family protein [Niabella beijingensis]|uniref:type VI secretion system Vgr family protein n=1 Tax=Niabella beijingensis TaxID=2872700 RepID=UPI001CC046ED|nr:type VI secretion system Vgr family protein [Niabella beijingensis]MBZ4191000.1 phage baseplate assembly protein V [Niabella beijingensis]